MVSPSRRPSCHMCFWVQSAEPKLQLPKTDEEVIKGFTWLLGVVEECASLYRLVNVAFHIPLYM